MPRRRRCASSQTRCPLPRCRLMKRSPGGVRSTRPVRPAGLPGGTISPNRRCARGSNTIRRPGSNRRTNGALYVSLSASHRWLPARSAVPSASAISPPRLPVKATSSMQPGQISGKRLATRDRAGSLLPANLKVCAGVTRFSGQRGQRSSVARKRGSRPRPGCGRPPAPPAGTPRPGGPAKRGAAACFPAVGGERRTHPCALPGAADRQSLPRQLLVRLLHGARRAAPAFRHLADGGSVSGAQLAVQELLSDCVCDLEVERGFVHGGLLQGLWGFRPTEAYVVNYTWYSDPSSRRLT